jgi:hypothetical protein
MTLNPPRDSVAASPNPELSAAVDAFVERWCTFDAAAALTAADRKAVDATRTVRRWIGELLLAKTREGGDGDRDRLQGWGALGRALAEADASPTLFAQTVDGAVRAFEGGRDEWVRPARSTLAESFFRTLLERCQKQAEARWEYPACAVRLETGKVAIAANFPVDDEEALLAWAGRVAAGLGYDGVRTAVLQGPEAAERALGDAFRIIGITVVQGGSRT